MDRTDFDTFYRNHFRFVWNAVRRLRVPHASEDDVLQEVFVEAAKALAQGIEVQDTHAWLYGVTRNIARNHWRKTKSTEALPVAAESGDFELSADADENPETLSAQSQAVGLLQKLLHDVAPENRIAFELVEIEGLSPNEASALLEVPVNTIYSRVRRGKEQLQRAHRAHTEAL